MVVSITPACKLDPSGSSYILIPGMAHAARIISCLCIHNGIELASFHEFTNLIIIVLSKVIY
jgi:hypothetical protein